MALIDNLVSYYRFDEITGTATEDSHTDNDGVADNARVFTSEVNGILNTCADFSNQDVITINGTYGFTQQSDFPISISTWVYLNSTSTIGGVIGIGRDARLHSGVWMQVDTDGKIWIEYGDNNGGASYHRKGCISSTALETGSWYHIVGIINSATDMHIYINGVDDEVSYSGTGGDVVYNGNTQIGRQIRITGDLYTYINGAIDELGIWNKALSGDEVSSLYNNGNGYAYPFSQEYQQECSETLLIVDSIINSLNREFEENLDVSEGGTKVFSTILSETLNLTSNVYRNLGEYSGGESLVFNGSWWDSYPESDAWFIIKGSQRKFVFIGANKNLTPTINLSATLATDHIHPTYKYEKTLSQTISLTDGDTYLPSREFEENLSLSEALAKNPNKQREEVLSLTDSEIIFDISYLLEDTLSLTDIYESILANIFEETLELTDNLSSSTNKLLEETISLTDGDTQRVFREYSEVINLSDTYERIWLSTQIFSETLTLFDGDVYSPEKVLNETLSLTDVYLYDWVLSREYEETLTLTAILLKNPNKLSEEEISLDDTYSRIWEATPTLAETINLKDIVRGIPPDFGFIDIEEEPILVDIIEKALERTLSIDNCVLTDQIIQKSTNRTSSDTINLSDSLINHLNKSCSETLNLTDVYERIWSATPELSETLTSTDTFLREWMLSREYSETLTLTDNKIISISIELLETMEAGLFLTDNLVYSIDRVLSEAIDLSDGSEGKYEIFLADTLVLSDTLSSSKTRELIETFSLTSSLNTSVNKLLSETISLEDNFIKLKILSEVFTLTDNFSSIERRVKTLSETISLEDNFDYIKYHTYYDYKKTLLENIKLIDGDTYLPSIAFEETLSLSEFIKKRTNKKIAKSIELTDNFALAFTPERILSETLTLLDSEISFNILRDLTDNLDILDDLIVKRALTFIKELAEIITLTTSFGQQKVRILTETLTLTASSTAFTPKKRFISLQEVIPILIKAEDFKPNLVATTGDWGDTQ